MTRNGQTYYYLQDALGSVRGLLSSIGQTIESYDYDPYGKPSRVSNANNPIMFTGRWYDQESGNYYYRARYYQPTLGRFLQRDLIGYYDSLNLFQYVGNNPGNWVDPMGLMEMLCKAGLEAGKEAGENGKLPKELPRNFPKNFKPPTNPPQWPLSPDKIPPGWRIRVDPPDDLYPNGHWHLQKPTGNGNWQDIDPSTMKPGTKPQTHIPFPPQDFI